MSELQIEAETGVADGAVRLTFEAWADLSARLAGLDLEARIGLLDEEGVALDEWSECERHYALVLADEIGRGSMERAEQYAKRCVAEMDRRKAGPPAAASNGSAPDAPPESAERGMLVKVGAPLEPGPVEVPSFLGAPVAREAAMSPPEAQVTTAAVFELPSALRGGALPFKAGAAPSLSTTPLPPRPAPEPPSRGGTEVLGATAPLNPAMAQRAALPFGGGTRAQQITYPRMPLQVYAALCAELMTYPQQATEIRARYGVASDEAQAALDGAWRARLQASAEVHAEWEALVHKHREGLLKQPK